MTFQTSIGNCYTKKCICFETFWGVCAMLCCAVRHFNTISEEREAEGKEKAKVHFVWGREGGKWWRLSFPSSLHTHFSIRAAYVEWDEENITKDLKGLLFGKNLNDEHAFQQLHEISPLTFNGLHIHTRHGKKLLLPPLLLSSDFPQWNFVWENERQKMSFGYKTILWLNHLFEAWQWTRRKKRN